MSSNFVAPAICFVQTLFVLHDETQQVRNSSEHVLKSSALYQDTLKPKQRADREGELGLGDDEIVGMIIKVVSGLFKSRNKPEQDDSNKVAKAAATKCLIVFGACFILNLTAGIISYAM